MSFVCPDWDDDLPSSPFDGQFKSMKKKRKREKNIKGNTRKEQNKCGSFVKLPKYSPQIVQNSSPNRLKRKIVVENNDNEIPRKRKKDNLRTENSQLNTKRKSKKKLTNSDIRQNLTLDLENISKKNHQLKRLNNKKLNNNRKIPVAINKISNIYSGNKILSPLPQKSGNQIVGSNVKSEIQELKNSSSLLTNISKKCQKQNRLNKSKLKYKKNTSAAIDAKATSDQISKNSQENQNLASFKQNTDSQIVSRDVKSRLDIIKSDVNKNIPYNISELKKCFDKTKSLCTTNIKTNKTPTSSLRDKMMKKLQSSHFRYLNEQLYCSDSSKSMKYFHKNTSAFQEYHKGYQKQVQQWPLNPLDRIINTLKKKKTDIIIADFGCGEALLAKSLPNHKVYSFDFVATSDLVTPCDMANTPLLDESVNVVVFCLSLMGANLNKFFKEANRVLTIGGTLMIAEVESRIENIDNFVQGIKNFGFVNNYKDFSHKIFYFLYFKKEKNVKDVSKLPEITLKPCLYKKR